MPKINPRMQKMMPISSSLCPLMEPLKKLTDDRSGNFSEASPPGSPAGCAKAAAAPNVISAATAEIFIAILQLKNAAVASQVRIEILRNSALSRNMQTCFRFFAFPEIGYPFLAFFREKRAFPNTLPPQDLRRVGAWPRRVLRQL